LKQFKFSSSRRLYSAQHYSKFILIRKEPPLPFLKLIPCQSYAMVRSGFTTKQEQMMSHRMGSVSKQRGTSREKRGAPQQLASNEDRSSVEKRLKRKRSERMRKRRQAAK
jgi:hypothetical protein